MELEDLAKSIRDACLEAVLEAYENAGVQGLCAEGRWEVAVDALRTHSMLRRSYVTSSGQSRIADLRSR